MDRLTRCFGADPVTFATEGPSTLGTPIAAVNLGYFGAMIPAVFIRGFKPLHTRYSVRHAVRCLDAFPSFILMYRHRFPGKGIMELHNGVSVHRNKNKRSVFDYVCLKQLVKLFEFPWGFSARHTQEPSRV